MRRATMENISNESLTKNEIINLIDTELSFYSSKIELETLEVFKEKIKKKLLHEKERLVGVHTSIVLKENKSWIKERKSSENFNDYYYDRYEKLLTKKFDPKTISQNDEITDSILDNLGDPKQTDSFSTRGLVVGSVQSGKTLNFTTLINKAADHGYKFIIVLAGIHNILREQTQERIDDGFIGMKTKGNTAFSHTNSRSGVGKIDFTPRKKPLPLTTFEYDFNKMKSISGQNLDQVESPVIAVIKKNKTVLENLLNWLDIEHQVDIEKKVRINSPLLIIDDEADNASINTSEKTVTTINNLIKEILNRFNKKSYVGYTATPFANIFIKTSDKDESIEADDLFPRNFITKLNFPSNYVGPDTFFGDEDQRNDSLVNIFDDDEQNKDLILDPKNKIFEVTQLSEELKKAIRNYVLVIATRIHRKDGDEHNSMLINFHYRTALIKNMKIAVQLYASDLRKAIKGFGSLDLKQGLQNSHIKDLHETFKEEFTAKGVVEHYEDIQSYLFKALTMLEVLAIHTGGDFIDYGHDDDDDKPPKYIIAIGGFSLGRGYTLEGLSVTFLSRKTATMDTLLQMGRWFGYRDGYEDLCRLYLNTSSYDNYVDTTTSLNELYEMFNLMRSSKNRTPLNFGLAVREHPGGIKVTAANKRRSARSSIRSISFRGTKYQAVRLSLEDKVRSSNYDTVINLYKGLKQQHKVKKIDNHKNNYFFSNVSIKYVRDFLARFEEPATFANKEGYLRQYLNQDHDDLMENWKVVFLSRVNKSSELGEEESDISAKLDEDIEIKPNARSVTVKKEEMKNLEWQSEATIGNSQIGNTKEELLTLDKELQKKILADHSLQQKNFDQNKSIGPAFIRSYSTEPILFIYPLILIKKKTPKVDPIEYLKSSKGLDFTFSVAFPPSSDGTTEKKITILENEIAQRYKQSSLFKDNIDEDEYEQNYIDEE